MSVTQLTSACFIEPLDVLFLRGNKLFGDPGSYGESLVPPWPSVGAGALRSRILVDDGVDLQAFAKGEERHASLGSPAEPGAFTLTSFQLARRFADGYTELLMAPPADLVLNDQENHLHARRLQPTVLAAGLKSSNKLTMSAVLTEKLRSKPTGGYWLTEAGWLKYLIGEDLNNHDFVRSNALWGIEHRVGVGLNAESRAAEEGKLFSMQAVNMRKVEHADRDGFDVGFIAIAQGGQLPNAGIVRLGGDGRGAALHAVKTSLPAPDYANILKEGRCRIVLTSPAIFELGWQLPNVGDDGRFEMQGVKGKLVCAAVPRYDVVSGWDIAQGKPKAAQRVAPAGSVYWLEELVATADSLDKLVANGLWNDLCENAQRRAEGFNRLAIAAY